MTTETQGVPLQPLGYSANYVLGAHFGNTDYLLPPKAPQDSSGESEVIAANEEFWSLLRQWRIFPGMKITLDHFHVMDWFPRAPGLYHTDMARYAREEALDHLHYGFRDSPLRDHAHQRGGKRPDHDYTVVFTPKGKLSMLEGGIGCIRLKPIDIYGEFHWLITATSDGIAHTGVPIAIPISFYKPVLRTIHERGSVCAKVHGQLEYLPDPFSRLFDHSEMVQRVYLRVVSNLERCDLTPVNPEASVAVSFLSDFKGYPDIYATYVTFRPDINGSFEGAISWMKHQYVEGEYHGRIITDFDQTQTIFKEARLALSSVMDRLITRGELHDTIELMNVSANVDAYFDEVDRQSLLPSKPAAQRTNVFVSYAHAPEQETGWVGRIRKHLEGLSYPSNVEWWDDSKLNPGDKWRREIEDAISRSRVAILVLTADFLASRFIREAELPLLLESADAGGATILCVYGSDVHLSGVAERLLQYQFVNAPDIPLQAMSETERESVYKKLVAVVEKAMGQSNTVSNNIA